MEDAQSDYIEARDALEDLGRRYRLGQAIPLARIERAARRKVAAFERMLEANGELARELSQR